MILSRLSLNNFMCFKDQIVINFENDITFFVGNNGSGKTAIFKALGKLFGKTKDERTILKSDFYLDETESFIDLPYKEMIIEAEFVFPEIYELSDLDENLAIFSQYIFYSEKYKIYKAILRLESFWDNSQYEYDVEVKKYWILADSDKIAFGIDDAYKILANNAILRYIDYVYIPAYRNSKLISREIIKKIGNIILKYADYVNISSDINELSKKINNSIQQIDGIRETLNIIKSVWQNVIDNELRYCSNLIFNVSPSNIESLIHNIDLNIELNNDIIFELDKLSDGQLSLLYITLSLSIFRLEYSMDKGDLQGFKDVNDQITTYTIFILEEPENHLSPFYLSKIFNTIYSMIYDYKNIISIVSTHSPAVINRVKRLEQIRYLKHKFIDKCRYTLIKSLSLPKKKSEEDYKYISQAVLSHPEIYFSKFVILGEGGSEELIIPNLSKKLGFELDPSFVSFVKLNGRHVNHMWHLLEDLELNYVTLLDFDLGRSSGGIKNLQYILKQLQNYHDKNILSKIGISNLDNIEIDQINKILKKLEAYNIFYSYPLDIDYLMISYFPKEYKIKYIKKKSYINAVFKSKNNYNDYIDIYKDQILLKNYKNLFINGSKISTHYMGLAEISLLDDNECIKKIPPVLKRLIKKVKSLMVG